MAAFAPYSMYPPNGARPHPQPQPQQQQQPDWARKQHEQHMMQHQQMMRLHNYRQRVQTPRPPMAPRPPQVIPQRVPMQHQHMLPQMAMLRVVSDNELGSMFSGPPMVPGEGARMYDNGGRNRQPKMHPMQQQPHQQPQQQPRANASEFTPMHQSSAPYQAAGSINSASANEKDELNYNNALQQVAKATYEIENESNKQRQHYNGSQQPAHGSAPANDSAYLTIPVAVETDSDKVLTKDELEAISQQVINELPNLKATGRQLAKITETHLPMMMTTALAKDNNDDHHTTSVTPSTMTSYNRPEQSKPTMMSHYQSGAPVRQTTLPAPMIHQTPSAPVKPMSAAQFQVYGTTPAAMSSATASTQPRPSHEDPKQHHQRTLEPEQQQYFLATGPMQEVGTFDPDQLADPNEYNLIKNDILNNFRYEPTRAAANGVSMSHAGQQQQQQTAQTPPMQMPYGGGSSNRPASVTRFFQMNHNTYQQDAAGRLNGQRTNKSNFGRMRGSSHSGNGNNGAGYTMAPPSQHSTKTILGGRKVSEVMRPLIHTTPVPMTSPVHVANVEPDKVDAIQLIAGHTANDKQPMVIEPHQLVSHTPDGGIDYNTGVTPPMQSTNNLANNGQQYQAINHTNHGQQQQPTSYGPPPTTMQQQHQQYNSPTTTMSPQDENQGAVIEYVAVPDQAADGGQPQQQQQMGQVYELNGPQQQQQQQTTVYSTNDVTSTPPIYLTSVEPQQPPEHQQMNPSLAWSPSVANEHQQHQIELGINSVHQLGDLPATAGYNLFEPQQQQQPQSAQEQQQQQRPQQDYNQQQPQQQETQAPANKWRTKAGGSQPNPGK